ncbi:BspA family leucine-rich repeat surface protein [Lacticaseibacillus suilingensis]|uniref:BspA family leucine-rich repeat surface protein n=1 Tax=Lacticaseibacillus suilingensis TaxID=2799577 RepID=A0ABW4BBX8_9LACO|nr:DUF285 domain-containing protein [Lacticaseibacillus suilingensis]
MIQGITGGNVYVWKGEDTGNEFSGSYHGGNADVYHRELRTTQGTWGSVPWRFENAVLYLSEGEGVSTEDGVPWFGFGAELQSVVLEGDILAPESISGIFAGFTDVTSYEGLEKLNLSQTTDMSDMFMDNVSLSALDLSAWTTSSVTNINSMFYNCANLSQIGLENWNVGNLDDIGYFLEGTKLESLNLSEWQFSGSNAYRAFASMSELQSIDISNFDTTETDTSSMLVELPNLVEITLGEKSKLLESLDNVPGKIWQGDLTGHQFGLVYNGGYPDTYRLTEGTLAYHLIEFYDGQNGDNIGNGALYGQPGEIVPLSQLTLPAGYELPDGDATIQLSESGGTWTNGELHLNRLVTTTTRTIQIQGLPEGHLKDEVQEIKWHWDWPQDDVDPLKRNLRFYEGVVHMPQGGYDEFTVPEVEGYEADISVVEAKSFDAELSDLPEDETVTVTYTKLDTGDGGNQNPDPSPIQPDPDNGGGSSGSTGTGSTGTGSIGGGQMTNLSSGGSTNTDQNQALPQTGSQVASGLTLLGLGLLGLLGFTRSRKRS